VWFWMYAIEEPAMGILAGIFAGWATLRRDNPQVNILIDVVIQQIICIGFGVIAYTVLIMWLSPNVSTHYSSNVYKIYRYLAITLIAIFFILTECFTLYQINAHKTQTWKLITFIYASSLVTISVLIFSFLLGPITTVSYLTYVNGKPPDVWVQIGAVYYLIPRVVVDSIKVPVISVILTSLILMIDPIIKQTKWNIAHQWET
jgi:hypothetical protein